MTKWNMSLDIRSVSFPRMERKEASMSKRFRTIAVWTCQVRATGIGNPDMASWSKYVSRARCLCLQSHMANTFKHPEPHKHNVSQHERAQVDMDQLLYLRPQGRFPSRASSRRRWSARCPSKDCYVPAFGNYGAPDTHSGPDARPVKERQQLWRSARVL